MNSKNFFNGLAILAAGLFAQLLTCADRSCHLGESPVHWDRTLALQP